MRDGNINRSRVECVDWAFLDLVSEIRLRGGAEDSVCRSLTRELAKEVAGLGVGEALAIAEFDPAGIVFWEVRRDQNGTPQAQSWPPEPWPQHAGIVSDHELDRMVRAEAGGRLILIAVPLSGAAAAAFDRLCSAYPETPVFRCTAVLGQVLRDVIVNDPLTHWYELVVLRRIGSGRLVLKGCQLFPPGAEAGDSQPFAIRCEPSDQYGTAFAVVAHEQVRRFELVSVTSAMLPPCSYQLTAELRRPGLVRFRGLPAELRADPRSWPELVAAVPPRFDTPEPAHLICAIEVSGPGKRVLERIDRIEQLIRHVASDAEGGLHVSVLSYGPHSFDRSAPEVPTSILSWAAPSTMALAELDRLRQRGPADIGYPRAAQLECMLTEVACARPPGWPAGSGHGRIPARVPGPSGSAHGDHPLPPAP